MRCSKRGWSWVVGGLLVAGCQTLPEPTPGGDDFGTDDTSGTTFSPGDGPSDGPSDGGSTSGLDGSTTEPEPPDPTQCRPGSSISGAEVESVLQLAGIERVTGTLDLFALTEDDLGWMQCLRQAALLSIRDSPALTSLDGLEGLEVIEGLTLEDNDALEHVDALAGLTELGHLVVSTNPALTSLDGLRDVPIDGAVRVTANPMLSSLRLEGAAALSSLYVFANEGLAEVHLPALESVASSADVRSCAQLVELDLSSLQSAESLSLAELGLVGSIDLAELREVDQGLTIFDVPGLLSLSLPNLERTGSLVVGQLPLLPTLELPAITELSLLALGWLPLLEPLPLLPDDAGLEAVGLVDLPLVDQLDRLGSPDPAMQSIELVQLPLVTELSVFAGVTSIGEQGLRVEGLSQLTSLAGLTSLAQVDGEIFIYDNEQLVSLDGLDALAQIGGNLQLLDNPALTSIDALWPAPVGMLQSVGDTVTISGNGALSQCVVDDFVSALVDGGWAGGAMSQDNLSCP